MFRTISVHHQEIKTVHTAAAVWHIHGAVCTVLNFWNNTLHVSDDLRPSSGVQECTHSGSCLAYTWCCMYSLELWNNTLHVLDDLRPSSGVQDSTHSGICLTYTWCCMYSLELWNNTLHVSDGLRPSSGVQGCIYSSRYMSNKYCYLQAGSSTCLTCTCCCMYSLELLMMDGDRPKHVQCYSKIK